METQNIVIMPMFDKHLNTILEDEFGDLDDQDTFGGMHIVRAYYFMPNEISYNLDMRRATQNYIKQRILDVLSETVDEEFLERERRRCASISSSSLPYYHGEGILELAKSRNWDKDVADQLISNFEMDWYTAYVMAIWIPDLVDEEYYNKLFVITGIGGTGIDGLEGVKIPWFLIQSTE